MKLHRAVTLVAMMAASVLFVAVMTIGAIASFDRRSLIALGVVIVAAAIGGIGFSWKRYFSK